MRNSFSAATLLAALPLVHCYGYQSHYGGNSYGGGAYNSGYGHGYGSSNYGYGHGSSYGQHPYYPQNFITFNVPRTQQIYFNHNHKNDELYGYTSVPTQNNYNTDENTAALAALIGDPIDPLSSGALDDA